MVREIIYDTILLARKSEPATAEDLSIANLIFLKMSDEYSKPPYKKITGIPEGYTWSDMNTLKGAELEEQYKKTLEKLAKEGGILGQIFSQSSNKISNAAILFRIVQMIDKEKWVSMSSDVKGEIYEGLLQKNAEDIKSGAGQYFTPRPLIRAMVECLRPEPKKTIADPCCGSGGFFLAAQEFLTNPDNYTLDREQKEFLKNETFYGNELVKTTFKMALMNLYLHNIGDIYGNVPVTQGDSLLTDPGYRVDYVLTNPPFGKKSSITMTNEEGEEEEEDLVYNRQDFWTTSSNKQLNFVQHINTIMKATGKAAVVVPDNVLFEGGAGETVRQKLLQTTDLHTILRLPTGIFYKPGVKANVFYDFWTNGVTALLICTFKRYSLESIIWGITLKCKALHRCELTDAEIIADNRNAVVISSHIGF